MHVVVDRIERAQRQEIEILPLRIERGAVVAEFRLRDQRGLLRPDLVQLDRAMPEARPERVGEPCAIGRPREVVAASGVAAIDHRQRAGFEIADQHFVAMVGDRDPLSLRCGAQREHAPDVPRERARLAGLEHLDALLAGGVTHADQRRAVGEPLAMPVTHAIGGAMLAHRAFPQREREELAARVDGQAVSGRMHVESGEMRGRRNEAARRLRAMRGHADVEAPRAVRGGVEQP